MSLIRNITASVQSTRTDRT